MFQTTRYSKINIFFLPLKNVFGNTFYEAHAYNALLTYTMIYNQCVLYYIYRKHPMAT